LVVCVRYAVSIYYLVPMHQCKICELLKWTLDAYTIYTKLHELTYPRGCMFLVNFKQITEQLWLYSANIHLSGIKK